ncbi:hypothetical protein FACS189479_05420 [Spirochaetia bacterium]|nr:hypothetical protein FACS189479_05420 [Spirochaetia bacterium]
MDEPDKPKKTKKTFKEIAARIKDKNGNPIDIDEVLAKKLILASLQEDADPSLVAKVHTLSTRDDAADPEMREIKLLKAKEDYEASRFKRELARGEYIPRDFIASVFGKIYSIHRTVILNFGPSLSGVIAGKMKVRSAAVNLEIEKYVTDEAYSALIAIQREINNGLEKMGAPVLPPEENPGKKKSRKKAKG